MDNVTGAKLGVSAETNNNTTTLFAIEKEQHDTKTSSSLSETQSLLVSQGQTSTRGNINITKLPYDIIEHILYACTQGDKNCTAAAVCLGMTCTQFYACFRDYHPERVNLGVYSCAPFQSVCICVPGRNCSLEYLLRSWFGSRYRLETFFHRFLLRDIYGDTEREEQRRLEWRYNDYRTHKMPDGSLALPNPYNMGHTWDDAAIRIIENDLQRHPDRDEWIGFWENAEIFDMNRHQSERWEDYFTDRSMMVGL